MKIFLLYCIVAFGALALANPIDTIGAEDVIPESDIGDQPESDSVLLADVESDEDEESVLFSADDIFPHSLDDELLEDADSEDEIAVNDLDDDSEQQDELVQDPQVPLKLIRQPLDKPLKLCALPPLYLGQKPQLVPSWWCQCPKGVIC